MNAVDPSAKRADAVIYKLRIVNPDPPILQLVKNEPVPIEKETWFPDLFTFDRSGYIRKNFEKFLGEYESRITKAVAILEEQIAPIVEKIPAGGHWDLTHRKDLDDVLFDIWVLKFINIGRNPYGVRKFRNSLPPDIQNFYPTDQSLRVLYDRILQLQESKVAFDLNALGITLDEYKLWLQALFLLFLPSGGSHPHRGKRYKTTMMEQVAYDLFHNPRCVCAVGIHVLSEDFEGRYLVSDRSYFYSANEPGNMTLHFNVTQQIAMTFMMVDPDRLRPAERELTGTLQKRIFVNDIAWSKWFNEATVFQARRHVYCSRKEVLGAEKVLPEGEPPIVKKDRS